MDFEHGLHVLVTMTNLEQESLADVSASLLATVYELSLRSGLAPRTIVNNAFESVATDEAWRQTLMPALRAKLGREE